jgi:hypothetical protein
MLCEHGHRRLRTAVGCCWANCKSLRQPCTRNELRSNNENESSEAYRLRLTSTFGNMMPHKMVLFLGAAPSVRLTFVDAVQMRLA